MYSDKQFPEPETVYARYRDREQQPDMDSEVAAPRSSETGTRKRVFRRAVQEALSDLARIRIMEDWRSRKRRASR